MKLIEKVLILTLFISSLSLATTIKTWKTNYPTGNSAWIKLENKPNNHQDWIGIYPTGTNTNWKNVLQWKWARTPSPATDPGDWYEFLKLPDGNYEARFFLNNTYRLEKFIAFSVGRTTSITTSKVNYPLNESITVKIKNQAKDNRNWIGIYPKGASNDWGNVVVWEWTHGENSVLLDGVDTGNYEVRLFYNNSFKLEAKTIFNVEREFKKYPKTTKLIKRLTDNTVPRPSLGHPTLDNVFGTQIKMVNKGNNNTYDSPYPKIQAWNSDMTLFRVGYRLYNTTTLEESPITKYAPNSGHNSSYNKLCAPASSDFKWSTKDPHKFYVLNSGFQLIEGHIVGENTNCDKILFDFKRNNFEQVNIGPGEGNIDFNDKYVAFPVKKKGDNRIYIFLYDLEKKQKVWNEPKLYDAQGAQWIKHVNKNGKISWTPAVLDWVSVSPSGKYILINDSKTGMYRYDINFQNKRRLEYDNRQSQGGHGDIGFDSNGNEVFVQFISGKGVYSFNVDNPNERGKKLLKQVHGGGFVSCRNVMHKGWCYVTTREEGYQEIFALKLDGTLNETVQRFTQTHGIWYGGAVSPDGTKIIFTNHWGTAKRDTFIAEAQ